ncbi:MAG: S-methyl-5-thioribose-1-phosphate isomerase [Candidatus Thermoplasmatota archaeon]|nr:S-methyl-5-thioribose-1-phosphate isomerase [Candidatus Thermoplasmatota archaeon]MBU1941710.1 S-methyl-5-thioribose-1-phosphate isomerase [Candidatus Thermoplasmatota archaeon]
MKINGKDQTAIWVKNKTIYFIDQRKLPFAYELYTAKTVDDIAYAIKDMVVRGAPAIGAAAAYGMALGCKTPEKTATILRSTRPTAHDLFYAVQYMLNHLKNGKDPFTVAETFVQDIIDRCRRIGDHGNTLIKDGMRILTHCNAGALATVDYGTALAPFRAAHAQGKNIFIYADETRPRLQGLLTAWELHQEGIPHVLIVDNAAGYFMQLGQIDMVITGADRIAANGDSANKIGTYEKAVLAKKHHIPFYVAAPISTFDKSLATGKEIIIEERSPLEITHPFKSQLMPEWVSVKNPAFDITPSELVTGYITETGVIKKLL